jgi:hypothetical protein
MKTARKYLGTLADLSDRLFPHTPIEVSLEDGEYHIYVEGEWNRKSKTIREVVDQVFNIIKLYGDDWWYPSTRVNAGWSKWPAVSVTSLAQWTA